MESVTEAAREGAATGERPPGVIHTRAPLRIALGGGGTDLPSYYREHGGFVVSAAISRHVHMLTNTGFHDRFVLKHLEWEEVDHPRDIRHPILRAALCRHSDGRPLEIASVADVPAGTGLGSSGAYAVCILKALWLVRGVDRSAPQLADEACELEIDVLERTVGKQDQYAAAHGGLNAYTFHPDGSVDVRPLGVSEATSRALRDEFLLFYAGGARSASDHLAEQVGRTLAGDREALRTLDRVKELAKETCAALEAGDLRAIGGLMNRQWELKRRRSPRAITPRLEELRDLALGAGAAGVMLMGAGGGGFLLVHAPEPAPVHAALGAAGCPELPFAVDREGCVAAAGSA